MLGWVLNTPLDRCTIFRVDLGKIYDLYWNNFNESPKMDQNSKLPPMKEDKNSIFQSVF